MLKNSKPVGILFERQCNLTDSGYQQYMTRILTQRCQQLKTDADKVVHDANTRIEALEGQIQGA